MDTIGQKPTELYDYWFVGYIARNADYSYGRVEVYDAVVESPFAITEIPIKIPNDGKINTMDFSDFVDDLETDYQIKTQEELLKLYNERE